MKEEIKEILLERWELKILIKNIDLHRKDFDAPIVEKAGHKYKPSTGHSWGNLDSLNDVELFCLYRVCRSSYRRSLSKEEYKKEGDLLLVDINLGKRKLGKVLSQKIYEYLI